MKYIFVSIGAEINLEGGMECRLASEGRRQGKADSETARRPRAIP